VARNREDTRPVAHDHVLALTKDDESSFSSARIASR
jgi:hypothetical protein